MRRRLWTLGLVVLIGGMGGGRARAAAQEAEVREAEAREAGVREAGARGTAGREAVVLSGGSARGLAHVGVLLGLESLGYDPDMVVGTSIGAVIGALYAAGYSPEEIRRRVLAIHWGEMFDPAPMMLGPDHVLRVPMLTFGLDLTERRASRGLFGEWRINRALVALLFGASARAAGDFDRLARRFRAVAADLETGERVVLGSGDLARATRASMAYPGFFAPVRWDERLLVDGGIADNLPTDVARRLGAREVISVDVSRPRERISLQPLAVAGRALDLMQETIDRDEVPPDLLIVPEETGPAPLGPMFPDDPLPLIELGLEATRNVPPASPHPGRGERPLPPAPGRFGALRVEAPDSALARLVRNVFAPIAPGRYDVDAVLAAVDRLYGTGLFTAIWPGIAADSAGDPAPALVVRAEAVARLSLSGAAGYDNDRGGRAWAVLDRTTSLARRPVVVSAVGSTDGLDRWASLSARIYASTRPALSSSAGVHVRERSVRSFGEDVIATVEVLRAGGSLALELPQALDGRPFTLTAMAEWVDPEDSVGAWAIGPVLGLSALPTNGRVVGIPLLLEAEARWGGRVYQRVQLAGSRVLAWSFLLLAPLMDLRGVGGDAPVDVLPALGDQHAIPGLRWDERRGRTRAVTGIDLAVPAPLAGFARLRVRTGAIGDTPGDWFHARWITGAGIGGIWSSPLGVLEVDYGHATVGDGRIDVSIGRRF